MHIYKRTPDLFHHLRPEPGGDARLWAKEQFSQEFAHSRADPMIQRKSESLFRFGGDFRRKQLPYEPAREHFGFSVGSDLEVNGEIAGQLQHVIVQIWHTDFQAMRRTGNVHFAQVVGVEAQMHLSGDKLLNGIVQTIWMKCAKRADVGP